MPSRWGATTVRPTEHVAQQATQPREALLNRGEDQVLRAVFMDDSGRAIALGRYESCAQQAAQPRAPCAFELARGLQV